MTLPGRATIGGLFLMILYTNEAIPFLLGAIFFLVGVAAIARETLGDD